MTMIDCLCVFKCCMLFTYSPNPKHYAESFLECFKQTLFPLCLRNFQMLGELSESFRMVGGKRSFHIWLSIYTFHFFETEKYCKNVVGVKINVGYRRAELQLWTKKANANGRSCRQAFYLNSNSNS